MVYMEMGARERRGARSNNRPRPGQLLINCYNLLQLKLAISNHYAIMVLLTKDNTYENSFSNTMRPRCI